MEQYVLEYTRRTPKGTGGARQLRRDGILPGILYGHGEDPVPLAIKSDDLMAFLREGQMTLTLQDGPRSELALVKEVQYDALGSDVIHVDFARVDADERVQVAVPIATHGTAKGAQEGGMVDQILHELNVECRALAIPESIRAEITELDIDQSLTVADLEVPEDVTVLDDLEATVIVVHPPRAEEGEAEAEEIAEDGSEPEVIGREDAEEAAEGEQSSDE